MALRLSRSLGAERYVEVGYGVSFTFRAFSFAEYKEVEAAAHRLARARLPEAVALDVEAFDDEDMPEEVEDATRGLFADQLVRLMLRRFGIGWTGVETDDGMPAPFEPRAQDMFLELFPGVTQVLHQSLLAPMIAVATEGKGSAPLPDTGTPVA